MPAHHPKEVISMIIGKHICAARKKKGLTQEQIAVALNTTKAAISRYEKGQRQPRYERLLEIAKVLGVSVVDLIEPQKHISKGE